MCRPPYETDNTVPLKKRFTAARMMPTGEVYVCGGGAYNSHLLEQLRWRLRKHNWSVQTTDAT
jgi:anhydro-N-acetylmuramic acid kinase